MERMRLEKFFQEIERVPYSSSPVASATKDKLMPRILLISALVLGLTCVRARANEAKPFTCAQVQLAIYLAGSEKAAEEHARRRGATTEQIKDARSRCLVRKR